MELKNMTGSLWKNDRAKSERSPGWTGSAVIHSDKYWLSAWVKTSRTGSKFLSLAGNLDGDADKGRWSALLFKNDRKNTDDECDYHGKIQIRDGSEYQDLGLAIEAYNKKAKDGRSFVALEFRGDGLIIEPEQGELPLEEDEEEIPF